MSHFVDKCSCGTIIGQCRCPYLNKVVTVIKNGCDMCQRTSAQDPLSMEAIRVIADQDPIETLMRATTYRQGYSRCRYCDAHGDFSYHGGQEWAHAKTCRWQEANAILDERAGS